MAEAVENRHIKRAVNERDGRRYLVQQNKEPSTQELYLIVILMVIVDG